MKKNLKSYKNGKKWDAMFSTVRTFLVLIILLASSIGVFAQAEKISISFENKAIEDVLRTIEDKSEYTFFYQREQINVKKKVSGNFKTTEIKKILEHIFKGQSIAFKLSKSTIILLPKKATSNKVSIKGVVSDNFGELLPGVNVVVKGTTQGTISDIDGNFTLDVDMGDILKFSFIGYKESELVVKNGLPLNVSLQEESIGLNEVVVIGYGSVRKDELTSSVTKINAEDFNTGVTNNPINMIKGKVAGLSIVNTSGSDPNSNPSIRLRGFGTINAGNDPLVVIDGVYSTIEDMNTLNANDIEYFNVLKDASSAAIYGTRGSNGVIIINTKTGKGEKSSIEYTSYYSTERPSNKLEMLDADGYLNMLTEKGLDPVNNDYGATTDWFDELTRNPLSYYQGVSFANSTEKSKLRVSMGFKRNEGLVIATENETTNLRVKYSQKFIDDKLTVSGMLSASVAEMDYTDYGAFEQAIQYSPTAPVYNKDGSYFQFPGVGPSNPVAMLNQVEDLGERTTINANVEAKLNLMKGLDVIANYTNIRQNYERSTYKQIGHRDYQFIDIKGYAEKAASFKDSKTFETYANYNLYLADHSINLMGGYSFNEDIYSSFNMSNSGYVIDFSKYNNIGIGSQLKEGKAGMSSNKRKTNLIAFFSRLNYSFKSKYLFSASVRREGSSRFGTENKWGVFPAVSAGWVVSREPFMKAFEFLSNFKLKAGYGVTGNQNIDPYISIPTLGESGKAFYNGAWNSVYGPTKNSNPNLQWEENREINVGFDYGLFDNRISGSVDVYSRLTQQLLDNYSAQVPSNIYPTIFTNVGDLSNKGFELELTADVIKTEDFQYKVTATYSYNKNTLETLSNKDYTANHILYNNLPAPGNLGTTMIYEKGRPIGQFYGFKYLGFDKEGKWVFEDVDKDGKYSDKDYQFIGNGLPTSNFSLSQTFKYKDFDLSIFLRGAAGFDVINTKRIYYENSITLPYNLFESSKDKMLKDGMKFSSYYVEKGDFIKIDNVTLGYNFQLPKGLYVKGGRIYVTGTNLYTFTGYTGLDPEVGGGTTPGYDGRGYYPRSTTFLFGLNVKL